MGLKPLLRLDLGLGCVNTKRTSIHPRPAVLRPLRQVIGSAIALLLLSRGAVPLWAGVILSVAFSFLLLLVERWGVTKLEALFGLLISIMVGSFAVMFYQAHVPLAAVAEGFIKPRIPRPAIGQAVALVGSLIMPHNIYLHSALVQTRALRQEDDAHKKEAMLYYGLESALSLLVSVFINMFVTCVFAAGFYGKAVQVRGSWQVWFVRACPVTCRCASSCAWAGSLLAAHCMFALMSRARPEPLQTDCQAAGAVYTLESLAIA
eukprot:GHRQ01037771.1.p1 GENE.GHRQ01037771.1~~GHRQ01037771.1.p1  ORF type:complete len:263 (+),score=71.73 GHRQ01037771.1:301-1089(+)